MLMALLRQLLKRTSLTRDDFIRDQFRTQDAPLTGGVSYLCRMPAAQWFIAEVADALLTMTIEDNWVKVGAVTVEDAVSAASDMLGAFQPMIGWILPIAVATLPANMLACDGATYDRVDYPNLYAVLDAAFIIDADTFMTPDLRDRVAIGDGTTFSVGDSGGEQTHTLTVTETPAHSHTDAGHTHVEGNAVPAVGAAIVGVPIPSAVPGIGTTGVGNANLANTGGGGAHNNLQPYLTIRYGIIAS